MKVSTSIIQHYWGSTDGSDREFLLEKKLVATIIWIQLIKNPSEPGKLNLEYLGAYPLLPNVSALLSGYLLQQFVLPSSGSLLWSKRSLDRPSTGTIISISLSPCECKSSWQSLKKTSNCCCKALNFPFSTLIPTCYGTAFGIWS